MKKVAIMLVALILASGTAFAAGGQAGSASIDLSGNFASEPASGFDDTFGLEIGANVPLSRLGMNVSTSKSTEVQGRVSLSYYNWDQSVFGNDLEYERIPFFVGGRVVSAVSPQFKVYGQLGLELSFDKVETFNPVFGKVSESDTNLGITPSVGILFPLSNQVFLGASLGWHIITDDYFTLGVTIGFNL